MGRTTHAKQHPIHVDADPLWYRDAIIYQLHVKSFYDANGDGIGDFPGLIQKLDYIQELGVNVIWLLPFYPSPRRDDGYDISDYCGVHTDYGTLADVRRFIECAHKRGIRVITELVVNHTSDQHPWFQRARKAKSGSVWRNFYVWSDTDQAYAGTRVIFVDTEKSNWTWDPVASAYYWHRFYAHQPDLNFDNPRVLREVLAVMRFWLDLGVDGLRLDAVPYLVERDGTNNENLPETHAILKRIRAELDSYAPGRTLLAEANQWPEDASQYFGDGDECNMSFHFPLMPRLYMSIAREDRFPITDIMRQTPSIPDNCQWVVFLRNHDELTLEMVTDQERDYLWNTYASDRRARLNLGIRRRLAPLLEHDRRRMELMNGLLLSMPGTPVIYYGDEIGMGDNVYLGDRDGVRTPMQWSPDRNGGFSRANPESLVLPSIMHPVYGFAAVNVEAQSGDQHSLLIWTRRLLAVRTGHRATFGRGAQRFLYPTNRKILAFLREDECETLLCVSNLSRTAQAVELDLSSYNGRVPVDLLGGSSFPPIGQLPYLLTLPPYAFYWFVLATEADLPTWHVPAPEPLPDLMTFVIPHGLRDVLEPAAKTLLETDILPDYISRRRWFAGKDQGIKHVKVLRASFLNHGASEFFLADCDVELNVGCETYQLPFGIVWEQETTDALPQQLAFARVRRGRRVGLLTDAFAIDGFAHEVLRLIGERGSISFDGGVLDFSPTKALDDVVISPDAPVRRLSVEQSNSSLIVGDTAVIKLLRRATPGIHPEVEMSDYLTTNGYENIPRLLGTVTRRDDGGDPKVVFVVQAFVRNQGDGWTWTLNALNQIADAEAVEDNSESDREGMAGPYLAFLEAIGKRLAEFHLVMTRPSTNTAFAPGFASQDDARSWADDAEALLHRALTCLDRGYDWQNESAEADIAFVSRHKAVLIAQVGQLRSRLPGAIISRIHGDFHLGQVLIAQGDAVLIDFEGEPARPLSERRAKANPLRDVAGMLRSLDYAHAVAMANGTAMAVRSSERRVRTLENLCGQASDAFLESYRSAWRGASGQAGEQGCETALLDFFLLQKVAYEICYEAANRATWLPIPLRGLANLVSRMTGESRS
jgi:maltose alpha-D-glucosyltransferase / alpha-amylase